MQSWSWTELLQMLEVTTTGSHTGSQVLTCNVSILILSAAEIFPILSASDVNEMLLSETKTFHFSPR